MATNTAIIDVASSGAELPAAIKVAPATSDFILSAEIIFVILSTVQHNIYSYTFFVLKIGEN